MSLTVTTDQQLIDSGIMIRNDFDRLIDKTMFPTGTGNLHEKAKRRVARHLIELPERVEESSITNPDQFHEAQLHYVAYQLYRRVFNKKRMDEHFKWFQEELSTVAIEVDNRETREMSWNRGILLERG